MNFAERTEVQYEFIENITDIDKERDGIFLQVQWLGLPGKQDWAWVPLADLYTDVPDIDTEFLRSQKTTKILLLKSMKNTGHSYWPHSIFKISGAV